MLLLLLIFSFIYLYILPALATTYPSQMSNQISDQEIDSRALFYTESDEALRAYYFLRLEARKSK